jgi:hypothetical protein
MAGRSIDVVMVEAFDLFCNDFFRFEPWLNLLVKTHGYDNSVTRLLPDLFEQQDNGQTAMNPG